MSSELNKMPGLMPDQEPQAHSELATFGEELKREREIRGISLKEISDDTKISKRFLEALERNDHKTLPAPVFTRGFVRQYARYLGLNAEDMVNRYNFAAAGDDRIEKSAHLERLVTPPTPEVPVRKGIPPPYARVDRNIYITIAIVIALTLVGWWAYRLKQQRGVDQADARPVVVASTSAAAAPQPAQPPAQPTSSPDTLRLTLDVNDDSWVTLEADGKTVVSDELKAGERRTFEAKDRFRFKTIGNAGGVVVTFNDVRVPALGRERQVVHDRIFDRDWLKAHAAGEQNHT
jgi:transcriptional regulator with XRE-family HTH domain